MLKQSGLCAICNIDVTNKYHVDHIIPLSKGGLHHPDNLRVITATENLRKHTKLIYGNNI